MSSKITWGIVLFLLPLSIFAQNPPAKGFNAAGSDAKAVAIADQVMEAMGGRKAWDATRYITWNFLGAEPCCGTKKRAGCASIFLATIAPTLWI